MLVDECFVKDHTELGGLGFTKRSIIEMRIMEISRRTDYAIRLIAALLQNDGQPLSVREAATMQDVPYAFARSIQHDLVHSGVLTSLRGARGGMLLAVDPTELTLYRLIEIVQGPVSVAICAKDKNWCSRHKGCQFHRVWEGANSILKDYLTSVSIKELIEGKSAFLSLESLQPAVK
ncbi:MAG: Rrf2 family transcriptional regulator [Coriobacteriales bacterium]|nr:Rrf2 family transcriptional regulator [Coriobacteriales bacterium]